MTESSIVNRDEEHLRLLSIFHYVVAGMTGLFALFPIFHVILGLIIVLNPSAFGGGKGGPPEFMGWFMVIIGSVIILLGLTLALCVFLSGRFIAQRRNYTFCLILAGLECMVMPLGTILGVFTLIVLLRDTVRPMFGTGGN